MHVLVPSSLFCLSVKKFYIASAAIRISYYHKYQTQDKVQQTSASLFREWDPGKYS